MRKLFLRTGLAQTEYAVAIFPLPALFEQVNAFESFENGSFTGGATAPGFETVVLRHDGNREKGQ
jgi:hypothetical protein